MSKTLAVRNVVRPGRRWSKAAVDRIVARFKIIKESNDGLLTAEAVVADAKSKDSPLHQYFEWNQGRAAMMWRLEQARRLMAALGEAG